MVNTRTPIAVSVLRHEDLASVAGADAPFDQPSTSMYMFDDLARLHPIEVDKPVLHAAGPLVGCGWRVGEGATLDVGAIPETDDGEDTVLRVDYVSRETSTMSVKVGSSRRQQLVVTPGLKHAWFVIRGQKGRVVLDVDGPPLCVVAVSAGKPVPGVG